MQDSLQVLIILSVGFETIQVDCKQFGFDAQKCGISLRNMNLKRELDEYMLFDEGFLPAAKNGRMGAVDG